MKVAELVAAFQRFAALQDKTGQTGTVETPPPPAGRGNPTAVAPQPDTPETSDRISVSPEAIFTFAASRFDPERITRRDLQSLLDILRDGNAISQRDRAILESPPNRNGRGGFFETDPDSPTNLVSEFQGRLSLHLADDDIEAVEGDTRALSILGRLASIRQEIV